MFTFAFNELKRTEGGPGVGDAVLAVKRAGIPGVKVNRAQSVFVGHEMFMLRAETRAAMRKALAIVKRSSDMVETVKDAMRDVVRS